MTNQTAIARVIEVHDLPDRQTVGQRLKAVADFQELVRSSLIDGHDYGVIPGTGSKATLLKPGAEKIAKLMMLADTYEFMDKIEQWDKPFFSYTIRCSLVSMNTGEIVSQGLGNCNSYEDKYRWREKQRQCPACGKEAIIKGKAEYGGGWLCFKKKDGCGAKFADGDQSIEGQPSGKVENPDPFTLVNTFMKMAKKRALVDAALSAGRLSDLFTQDMDDIKGSSPVVEVEAVPEPIKVEAPPKKKSNVNQLIDDIAYSYDKTAEQVIRLFGGKKLSDVAKEAGGFTAFEAHVRQVVGEAWGDPMPIYGPDGTDEAAAHLADISNS